MDFLIKWPGLQNTPQFYIQLVFKAPLCITLRISNPKIFFLPSKSWKNQKTTSKSWFLKQKFRRFRNFSFTAQQPKWQNSCSKMWPIEQLYIELIPSHSAPVNDGRKKEVWHPDFLASNGNAGLHCPTHQGRQNQGEGGRRAFALSSFWHIS